MGSDATPHPEKKGGISTTVTVVLAWYISNIGMLLLNKAVLSSYNFSYPIFLTACHQACGTVLSMLISTLGIMPHQPITSRAQLYKIATLAIVFSLSIAIGATTPAITAVMALCVLRKRETRQTYLTLVPVVVGIVIASGWEPQFHTLGFLLCLTATATRSLKTVLQALLLSDPAERMGSLSLMYYMSPIALAALLPMVALFEDAPLLRAQELWRADPWFGWAFTANVLLSYAINLTNFLVTHHTSALTIQVLGNAKGAVAVVVSVLVFRNPVSLTGMLGYSVCVAGCFAYSEVRVLTAGSLHCDVATAPAQSKRRAAVGATLKKTQDTLAKLADVEVGGWATGKAELGKTQQRGTVSVYAHPGGT